MARIRTIKPEFFTSEDIVALSPLARLLYVACWCEADREGRMEWRPGTMKLRYFPGDACDIHALAGELIERGLIVLYEIEDRQLAEIPSFGRHQVVNNRETGSRIPARVGHASGTRQARVKAEGRKEGKEGRVVPMLGTSHDEGDDESSENDHNDSDEGETSLPVVLLPLSNGSDYTVREHELAPWATAFPAVDVPTQLHAMAAWLNANPKNRKTRAGIQKFIVNWLGRAQNSAPRVATGTPQSVASPFAGAI